MSHRASRKSPPTPLKDVQIAVQADGYPLLDTHSSLAPPVFPIERQAVPFISFFPSLRGNHSPWQVLVPASHGSLTRTPCVVSHLSSSSVSRAWVESSIVSSDAPNYCSNNSIDNQDDNYLDSVPLYSLWPYRSFTPPISSPALSLPATDTEFSSKRSGMTFALVPTEVDGKHVFTHVVVDSKSISGAPSTSSTEDRLPEDMQDILRQLDELASWVKAAGSSRDYISNIKSMVHTACFTGDPGTDTAGDGTSHLSFEPFSNKGKKRLLSTTIPNSEFGPRRNLVESPRGAMPGNPAKIFPGTDRQAEGFIYVPNCNTPEFLVGSSNSPVAYPVCGYSSHPSHYSPHPPGPTHDIPRRHCLLDRRSVPCPPPTTGLVSPPLGKTSFKTLFQRSRCSTTAVSRPSIPSGHVPVEGALRQGKRMRLPWLKI